MRSIKNIRQEWESTHKKATATWHQYKFRTEHMHDLKILKKLLKNYLVPTNDWHISPQFIKNRPLPDIEVTFLSPFSLGEIKHIVRLVPDGHVIYETIAPAESYTGERTFEKPPELD